MVATEHVNGSVTRDLEHNANSPEVVSLKKQNSKHASHVKETYPAKPGALKQITDEEWRARVDLAATYRCCKNFGFSEGINNHITAMVPGQENRFLVFAFGLGWNEVTASNLLTVDFEGNVVSGEGIPEATAFYIHSRLHMKHPKAGCIIHTHQAWSTALACTEDPTLPMIHQNSLRFYDDLAYDPEYTGVVVTEEEGDRLARVMGDKKILIHSNHGVMVATETIAEAWDYLYYLERAAEVTVKALSSGRPLKPISKDVCEQLKKQFKDTGVAKEYARLHLEALKREMLHGKDADFAS